tara:strand:- start:319 stop:522 length:204 start_codon:yes stop_codon:yes gene_type:complete
MDDDASEESDGDEHECKEATHHQIRGLYCREEVGSALARTNRLKELNQLKERGGLMKVTGTEESVCV